MNFFIDLADRERIGHQKVSKTRQATLHVRRIENAVKRTEVSVLLEEAVAERGMKEDEQKLLRLLLQDLEQEGDRHAQALRVRAAGAGEPETASEAHSGSLVRGT